MCIEFCGHLTNDFFVILSFYGDFQTITKGPFAILYDAPFGFHKKTIQIISRRPCHISMKNDLSIFWISINACWWQCHFEKMWLVHYRTTSFITFFLKTKFAEHKRLKIVLTLYYRAQIKLQWTSSIKNFRVIKVSNKDINKLY